MRTDRGATGNVCEATQHAAPGQTTRPPPCFHFTSISANPAVCKSSARITMRNSQSALNGRNHRSASERICDGLSSAVNVSAGNQTRVNFSF